MYEFISTQEAYRAELRECYGDKGIVVGYTPKPTGTHSRAADFRSLWIVPAPCYPEPDIGAVIDALRHAL